MNTKYLWDKEGNDDEIERLESALSGYRFQADAVPSLRPAEVAVPARRFGWFRFSLAASFAAATLLIAATAVMIDRYRTPRTNDVVVQSNEKHMSVMPETTTPPEKNDQYYINPVKPEDKRKVDRHYIPPVVKPIRKVAPPTDINIAHNKKLTRDERYAYNQLLVALWLTGSKLKVVQDTINRVDDKKNVTDKNER